MSKSPIRTPRFQPLRYVRQMHGGLLYVYKILSPIPATSRDSCCVGVALRLALTRHGATTQDVILVHLVSIRDFAIEDTVHVRLYHRTVAIRSIGRLEGRMRLMTECDFGPPLHSAFASLHLPQLVGSALQLRAPACTVMPVQVMKSCASTIFVRDRGDDYSCDASATRGSCSQGERDMDTQWTIG
jgi:hypothetical protein